MDQEALRKKLPANARLLIGELADTVTRFLAELNPETPIGFAAVDVDYYSSALAALQIFADPIPSKYLPLPILYLDDIVLPSHSRFSGELLAVGNSTRPTSTARSTSIASCGRSASSSRPVDRSDLSASRIRSSGDEHGRKPAGKMYSPVNVGS